MIKDTIDSFRDKYYFLSNFYPCKISFDGETYNSVEAAYQAQKTLDLDKRKQFINITPEKAKRLGRTLQLRPNWDQLKVEIMIKLLVEKFKDSTLLNLLIQTNPAKLIEGNNWNDTYWEICKGKGKNMLGKLLMEIRHSIMVKIIIKTLN